MKDLLQNLKMEEKASFQSPSNEEIQQRIRMR